VACGARHFQRLLSPDDMHAEQAWLRAFYDELLRSSASLKDRTQFTQHESTFVVRCNKCGTLMRNPRPTAQELRLRYEHDHYGADALEELLESQLGFFKQKAHKLKLTQGSRVVELGSYTGAFLQAAKECGWDATGVDVGKDTAEFCLAHGLKVIRAELEQSKIAPNSIDAFFIWNTFDQLAHPKGTLESIRQLLRPGGLLLIRAPNGDFESAALNARANSRWRESIMAAQALNNFLTFPYIAGYTPRSLSAMLSSAGFQVIGINGDVIAPLFGERSPALARSSEQRWKRLTLRICDRIAKDDRRLLHPWFEVMAVSHAVSHH